MDSPAGYIVRPRDMKKLEHALNGTGAVGDIYDAARTLVGWAEPQQTQPPPVSVASLALSHPDGPPVLWDPADQHAMLMALHIHSADGRCIKARSGQCCSLSPEGDALDRIEAVIQAEEYGKEQWDAIFPVFQILRETGRL